jgi:hypothetical protein
MHVYLAVILGVFLFGYVGHKLITKYLKSVVVKLQAEKARLKASAEAEAKRIESKL